MVIDNSSFCPMIHSGLNINLNIDPVVPYASQCCLHKKLEPAAENIWKNKPFIELRRKNLSGQWDAECWTCQSNENAGLDSLRTGTIAGLGTKINLTGPQRLDLLFNVSCNLACRTCGPNHSTFWQKHLKENNIESAVSSKPNRTDDMIELLKTLDLSNLKLVVFAGGETLLGNDYWRVTETILDLVDRPEENLTLSFQTNGTQPIDEKYYPIIERCRLVKLNVSLDGVGERFNYLRWPAQWEQVVDNLYNFRNNLPVNVMFLVEETMSIFNLYYQEELSTWVKNNFSTNRLGDEINHTRHSAWGMFSLDKITEEYYNALPQNLKGLFPTSWRENPEKIRSMIDYIEKFDQIRNESWGNIFPDVHHFYRRYTN